jgi:hypothetical protein
MRCCTRRWYSPCRSLQSSRTTARVLCWLVTPQAHTWALCGGAQARVITAELETILLQIVHENTAYELAEMADRLHLITNGVRVSKATISRALKRCCMTKKKKTTVQRANFTEENRKHTAEYTESMAPREAQTVSYFDETMVSSRDVQRRSNHWSRSGTPAYSVEPSVPAFKLSCAALTTLKPGYPPLLVRVGRETTLGATLLTSFIRCSWKQQCYVRPTHSHWL